MKDGFPVSLAELLAAGQRPLPSEAVAIVLDVCRQVLERPAGPSVLPPISTAALFIDGGGRVAVAGGVPAEDDQTVPLLARVLLLMLAPPGTTAGAKVPSRLRLLAARAASGEAPRLTVKRFAASLLRFAPPHTAAAVRALFRRWSGDSPRDIAWADEGARSTGEMKPGTVEFRPSAGRRTLPGLLSEPVPPPRPRGVPRLLRAIGRHMLAVGATLAALMVLAGFGARYWLNAKEILPPLPVNPAILLQEPPRPARGGWELLADPAGLAVDAQSESPMATDGVDLPRERHISASARTAPAPRTRPGVDALSGHKPIE